MRRPRVEILYFDGCPNHEAARALIERAAAELSIDAQIELVRVDHAEAAAELEFLGSPTIRVDGRDVEPGAAQRHEFVFSCRVYRGERGLGGQPDEAWIRSALTEAAQVSEDGTGPSRARAQLPAGVATVLAAAEIPASKLGSARRARLSEPERELYFWILRRFATNGRPSGTETRETAARLGFEVEEALASRAREDLVHRGSDGEITVAYPFSGRETAHRVRFPGGHEVHAMCAIDALGIAPMFEQTIQIRSDDPVTGEAFQAEVAPDGRATWEPCTAVVVAGVLDRQGDSCCGCCPVLNFFVSEDTAQRWLSEHPQVSGQVITVKDAVASGRAVFRDVFQKA
jgi:hypothetical protein